MPSPIITCCLIWTHAEVYAQMALAVPHNGNTACQQPAS